MISRRNYFSIVMMMALLFGIIMFSVIVNKNSSSYDINEFVVEDYMLPTGRERFVASEGDGLVIFFGGQQDSLENIITQWCLYTKRALLVFEQIEDYFADEYAFPELILLDVRYLRLGDDCEELIRLTELGVPVVFCNLPDASYIADSPMLREILGIKEVVSKETDILGVRLFDGFFIGGTATYEAKTSEEEELQDFELNVPWYINSSGTKVYMVGIKDEEEVEDDFLPCLIWRNSYKDIKVFAAGMDYMSSPAGLGILSAFMYELRPYEIYPVVNAQNVLVNNFPNFSEENDEKIMELYSRSPQMYFQGIMWPSISAMAKTDELKLTCFFNTQYDYNDSRGPKKDAVSFYLQQLKELSAEAGMAVSYIRTTFKDMAERDAAFYKSLKSRYKYQTVFAYEKDIDNIRESIDEEGMFSEIVSVGSTYIKDEALVSYLTDDVTLQMITADAGKHTYRDDFDVRGVQTALLYSNVLMELRDAVWPKDKDDEWQLFYDEMASNVRTYWSGYQGYEQTTMSESDYRVRTMLNLDYSHERTSDKVVLNVENAPYGAWFILRTHDELIAGINGGEFKELEANTFLIHVKEPVVEIELRQASLKEQKER